MFLIRVKDKYQVTIPAELREKIAVEVGDILEAAFEGNKITLSPKRIVDRDATLTTSSASIEPALQ